MTVNGTIAVANASMAVLVLVVGALCAWRARAWWRHWPVSALIATGGVFVGTGLVLLQLSLLRVWTLPDMLQPNGWGTLVLRIATLVAVVALTRRILVGRLLTDADRLELLATGGGG